MKRCIRQFFEQLLFPLLKRQPHNSTLQNGTEILAKIIRFLSLDLDEVGVINYEITALNKEAKIIFNPYIDAGVTNEDANWEEKFWEIQDVKHTGNEAFVTARTFKTHFVATTFMHNTISPKASPTPPKEGLIKTVDKVMLNYEVDVLN